MQPFNLDRFRAGEPAYLKIDNSELFFLAEFPNDRIAVKYFDSDCDVWDTYSISIQNQDGLYMKEKEMTYVELWKMWWANDKNSTVFDEWLDENFEAPKRKNK